MTILRPRKPLFFLVALLAAFLAATARCETATGFLAARDGHAFVPVAGGVEVFDIRTPSRAIPSAMIPVARGSVLAPPAFHVDTALLPCGSGVALVDLTLLDEPKMVCGFCATTGGAPARRVQVAGDVVLVEGDDGIRLFDASDPYAPAFRFFLEGRGTPGDFFAASRTLLPVFTDDRCRIYEITPDELLPRGIATVSSNSTCVFLADSIMLETSRSLSRIHDFTNPDEPTAQSFTNAVLRPLAMPFRRGRLWTHRDGSIEEWNTWEPRAPRRLRSIALPSPALARNAIVEGGTCLSRTNGVLCAFRLSGTNAVAIPIATNAPAGVRGLAVPTSTNAPAGVRGRAPDPLAYRIRPPKSAPAPDAFPPYLDTASLALHGHTLYFTWPPAANAPVRGIVAVDVSDPAAPRGLGFAALGGYPVALAAPPGHDLLFCVDGTRLLSFGIHRNGTLRPLGELLVADDPVGGPQALAWAGEGRLLIACGAAGVAVVDVRDPRRMAVVSALPADGYVRDIVFDGQRAWTANDTAGAMIFLLHGSDLRAFGDVVPLRGAVAALAAAPSGPVLAACGSPPLAAFDIRNGAPGLAALDEGFDGAFAHAIAAFTVPARTNRVFAALAGDGLSLYDVTDASAPVPVRPVEPAPPSPEWAAGPFHAVLANGPVLYLLSPRGLLILDAADPSSPCPLSSLVLQ